MVYTLRFREPVGAGFGVEHGNKRRQIESRLHVLLRFIDYSPTLLLF